MSEAATSTELVSTQHLSDEYNHYVKNEVGTQETVDYWPKHINKPKQIETTKNTSGCLKSQRQAAAGVFVIFTIVIIISGVCIVCLTSPKAAEKSCALTFISVVGDSVGYYPYPFAVSVGDFNNDTWLDIAIVNQNIDAVGVFLNRQNGTFASQKIYSTGSGSHPISIAVGNINNDSRPDIVVGNFDTNSICILFGYGDGTFINQSTFSTGASRPKAIALGDFNKDGYLDIAIANYGTNNVGIMFGFADGSFGLLATYSIGYSIPYSIVVNDFNNDHQLDIAVTNYDTHEVSILIGYSNGTFASAMTLSTGLGSYPYGIAIGNFNNDNYMDIVVANSGNDNIGIFFGYENGRFEKQITYFNGISSKPSFVAVGDFDNDHQLDVAVSNTGSYSVSIFLGYGNGTFRRATTHSLISKSSPFGIVTGDFDKDNHSDVVVANAALNTISLLTQYATKASPPTISYSIGNDSAALYVDTADFNNDNCLDIAVSASGNDHIGIFLGHCNGSFSNQVIYPIVNQAFPIEFVIGDMNNDNQLDIVTCNFDDASFSVLLGYGNGTFADIHTYSVGAGSGPGALACSDFNKDTNLDLVFANYHSNTVGIVLGYGNGTFENGSTSKIGDHSLPYWIDVNDLNNDGNSDIVVVNYGTNTIGIFFGYGNGTFRDIITYSTGYASNPKFVEIGDLNNDNLLDIVVVNTNTNQMGVFLNYGNESFASQVTYSTSFASLSSALTLGYLNDDNYLDAAMINTNLDSISVFLGFGDGTFTDKILFPLVVHSIPTSIAMADVNNDRCSDLIVLNYGTNDVAILLGHSITKGTNGTINSADIIFENGSITSDVLNVDYRRNLTVATEKIHSIPTLLLGDYYSDFQTEAIYSTGSGLHPFSIAAGDLNNDTQLDLVITYSGIGIISIFLGMGNGSFENKMNYSIGLGTRPEDVILRDFNNDNRLDVFVVDPINDHIIILVGTENRTFAMDMTISTGIGSQPNSLATSDFNNDGLLDLVYTSQGTDSIGLLLGFNYSSFKNPIIYSTGDFSDPLGTAAGDMNDDDKLDIVVCNSATSSVVVYLGHGDGTFTKRITDLTSNGLQPIQPVLGDFNNDNKLDIAMSIWPTNIVGVLLGYGNGSFTPLLTYSTGFNARIAGINVGDFNNDKKLDIAVANSGVPTICIFFGYGNGSFDSVRIYSTGEKSSPNKVAVYDLNNDGRLDIVSIISSHDIGILFGYDNGSFQEVKVVSIGMNSDPRAILAADFNNDNILDIAVGFFDGGIVNLLFGHTNGSYSSVMTLQADSDSGINDIKVGDFNNDKHLDIIFISYSTGHLGILFGFGNGYFSSATVYVNDPHIAPCCIVVGDWNSDGKLDLAFSEKTENNLWILVQTNIKHFGSLETLSVYDGSKPSSIVAGDFNSDGQLDIAVANSGTDNIGILTGHGDGTFNKMIAYSTGDRSQPSAIAIGDINNDTFLDIVVASRGTENIVIFLGHYNGSFIILTSYSTGKGSSPLSIALNDFNNDHILDIAVANFGVNNIGLLEGYGNGSFKKQIVYSVGYGAHPNKVIFGNFTNDSWMEIAVANYDTDTVLLLLRTC